MDNIINRKEIGKGIYFSHVTDKRFKVNRISAVILTQLDREKAAENAIIPLILSQSSADYPDFTALNNRCSELYGATLSYGITKLSDTQAISLVASSIDDKYALDGEKITEELTRILIGCLLRPNVKDGAFDEKALAREKQNLIDAIEAEFNEKQIYALTKLLETLCEGEPAGVSKYGDMDKIDGITAKSAYENYKRLLTNARIEILCVGCNKFDAAEKMFTDAFSGIERNNAEAVFTSKSPLKAEVRELCEKMDVAQSKLVLGMKCDNSDREAMVMVQKIFGGTTTSKLFTNVREKMSLCYYCSARYENSKGIMYVQSGVEKENIEKARVAILAQLDDMKNGSFTDDDILHSKMDIINGSKEINDSTASIMAWYLTRIYLGEIITPEQDAERFDNISRERIIAAANTIKLDTVYVLTSNESEDEN